MRVLVVDDDPAVRDSLARTLRFEGHEVETAADGRAALDAVAAREPDAMILDVSMPVLDGLQTCQLLRADGVLVPVLMVTARDGVQDRVAGLDAGALPVDGADEIARLGSSVNTLLAAIDSARRAQRALVEDAGHELRTPMTSLRTNVELLLEIEKHPERAHRLLPDDRARLPSDIDAQIAELASLTTELVELARDESTRKAPEDVPLADLVEAAVARVWIRAQGLRFDTDLLPATVHGRPGELERMVVNVLDNAAKWSPAGATVHTTLRRGANDRWVLTVTDTGPGIDDQDRPYVFDRFYRARASRSMPGSGLGLAIVAQTATQHGGTATVTPNVPRGTTVTIEIPGDFSRNS